MQADMLEMLSKNIIFSKIKLIYIKDQKYIDESQ